MSYKKALEIIKKNCGQVCEEYETCDHPACQSSYNSWAIADEALNQGRPYFRIWVIGMFFLTVVFLTICLFQIKEQKNYISELETKIEQLEEKHTNLNVNFITYKQLTSDEFKQTWRSFGAVRANFLALGTGKFLCSDDIKSSDDEIDYFKE